MRQNYKYFYAFILATLFVTLPSEQMGLLNYYPSTIAKESVIPKDSIPSKENAIDWRNQSSKAAELIFYRKHAEGDAILAKILPIARKEDPNGIDFGVCLTRYGYGLMGENKYQQSLATLQEALNIVQKAPQTKRQEKALFQILKATATIYYQLNQFDKAEKTARAAIAYRIAFPYVSSLGYFKRTYDLLRVSLENQKNSTRQLSLQKYRIASLKETSYL